MPRPVVLPTITVLTGGFSRGELEEAGSVAVLPGLVELGARLDLLTVSLAGSTRG